MKSLTLESFRLKNFKAVQDSGDVTFTPLTVFIGNNGSGKSSLIEGLRTFRNVSQDDLVEVMEDFHGYEWIRYKGSSIKLVSQGKRGHRPRQRDLRVSFRAHGGYAKGSYEAETEVGLHDDKQLFISREQVKVGEIEFSRNGEGHVTLKGKAQNRVKIAPDLRIDQGLSIIHEIPYLNKITSDWQFLNLDPGDMGEPKLQYSKTRQGEMIQDGTNIAEYLKGIKENDPSAFEGIVETLKYVLPYARDLRPAQFPGQEQKIYLEMKEGEFIVPSFLLSTGTLRLLGLLALLRHPQAPALIVIEEIENGLDPSTLSLLVEEIRNAVESGKTQVIATTHSPYFLDLLDMSQIVLVERADGQQPTFIRPADQASLKEWSKKFSPGQLYTMNVLSRKDNA